MPFDNIKTRMQSQGASQSMGMFKLALSMLVAEGPLVFWRATTPRLARLTVSHPSPWMSWGFLTVASRCQVQSLSQYSTRSFSWSLPRRKRKEYRNLSKLFEDVLIWKEGASGVGLSLQIGMGNCNGMLFDCQPL
jgi:Mitochondrial carrier protein